MGWVAGMTGESRVPLLRTLSSSGGGVGGMMEGQLLEPFLSQRAEEAEEAFSSLVAIHGPMVWDVCRSILADSHAVEDAFQATFLVLVRRAGSIRRRDAVGPWLHGVARRIAVRTSAIAARRQSREGREQEMTTSDPDPGRRGQFEALHEEVGRLAERYRAPLVLCYFEGRTHAEAARLLRCPVGTVSVRLSRARNLLRSRLTRRGVILPAAIAGATLGHLSVVSALPLGLAESTTRAAMHLASGKLAMTGVVSASVAHLVRWEVGAMMFKGMTWAAAGLLMTGAATVGIGRLAANRQPEPPGLAPPPLAVAPVEGVVRESDPQAKARSMSNLKIIGRAMFGYASRHNATFPAAAIRKDGMPLLSWRVAILPDINQGALYRRFHLDEPWDSPHNKALLGQMPEVYAPVTPEDGSEHSTYYQVLAGPGTLVGGRGGTKLDSVKDGLGMTLMVVEAAKPVPWTKPEDVAYDIEKPLPEPIGRFGDGFCACFADGSVRFLRRNVAPDVLKALVTPNGREKVAFDQFLIF